MLENDALEKLYNQKQVEQEKINFKYQKAQSEFLEIMRELSRFRGEFLDNYSLRSKLLHTLSIQQKIAQTMKTQESILNDETKKRESFDEARQMLFESKFVNFINLKLLTAKKPEPEAIERPSAWKFTPVHQKALKKQLQSYEQFQQMKS